MFLRCSSVWFPAVKGAVFPFSFSWCRSGGLGRGPAPARLGSVPGTPGICVSCELCTVAPGRSRGWRTEGSPRGLRARCRRYLLLSYCCYLFCTVSAAFVRDNKPLQQPPPARPWGAARHQGALPRAGAVQEAARARSDRKAEAAELSPVAAEARRFRGDGGGRQPEPLRAESGGARRDPAAGGAAGPPETGMVRRGPTRSTSPLRAAVTTRVHRAGIPHLEEAAGGAEPRGVPGAE